MPVEKFNSNFSEKTSGLCYDEIKTKGIVVVKIYLISLNASFMAFRLSFSLSTNIPYALLPEYCSNAYAMIFYKLWALLIIPK